jgi:hypothetical protein
MTYFFMTFRFKLNTNDRKYDGKYQADYLPTDLETPVKEVQALLATAYPGESVNIGVLSFSYHNYSQSLLKEGEIKCFDFYCEEYSGTTEMYVNGLLIPTF